jgi:hypothetical protein
MQKANTMNEMQDRLQVGNDLGGATENDQWQHGYRRYLKGCNGYIHFGSRSVKSCYTDNNLVKARSRQ